MNLCIIPTPPSLAKAIDRAASVTESILAETNGMFKEILFVSFVLIETSFLEIIGDFLGFSSTSSKVNPSKSSTIPEVYCF